MTPSNSLIVSKNIESDFKNLVAEYPKILKCIPVLLAVRSREIYAIDSDGEIVKKANGYDLFCQPETFPAGTHTVVIEIEGAGTIHEATIVQYVAPTE